MQRQFFLTEKGCHTKKIHKAPLIKNSTIPVDNSRNIKRSHQNRSQFFLPLSFQARGI